MHIKIENKGNQLTGRTKEQIKIGMIAKIPAGFQNGVDKRHSPIVNKKGPKTRRKLIILFFICIRCVVYQISILLHGIVCLDL